MLTVKPTNENQPAVAGKAVEVVTPVVEEKVIPVSKKVAVKKAKSPKKE